jgi:hypothetical protein
MSTPTTARPSAIAIDAKWFERLGRRYLYWRRAFPQTIARANRQVSLRIAAINFAHFRDHGGPGLNPCDRDGVDAEVLAAFERDFLRRATPYVVLDLLGEIDALHNAVLDLDPAFCWEPTVRKFVNRLTRHPEEEGERDERHESDAGEENAAP